MVKKKPRKIIPAMQKAAFRKLAEWIAADDDRIRDFRKAHKKPKQ